MTWRQFFAMVGIVVAMTMLVLVSARAMEGPDKMVRLYNTSRPACSSCHTEERNSLADYGSRGSIADAKEWLRHPNRQFDKSGKKGLMPAYKMPDDDLEALARYLMTLEE
jgi:mono/diheme cytochrome c family protein